MGGRIVVSADNFYRLGGYDERIEGWGPDDLQFCLRARDAGLNPIKIPPHQMGKVIAHDAESRVQELSAHARAESEKLINSPVYAKLARGLAHRSTRHETVANGGHFGCGEVTINFAEQHHMVPLHETAKDNETPGHKNDWAKTLPPRSDGIERS